MKKLIAIIVLIGAISLGMAQTNNYNLTVALTTNQVNTIKMARVLENQTNQTVVEYAGAIASDALVKKAEQVNRENKQLVYRYWDFLSDSEKKSLVDAAKAAKEAAEAQE